MPPSSVYRLYQSLLQTQPSELQAGLGGKLLYAGEMDADGRDLLYAANIAGAASLAASADPVALRHAMRDGVIDFFVNSLEEALRILKNEIRKRQTVSVGVAGEPCRLVDQMLDRGVLPDLLPHGNAIDAEQAARFLEHGSRQIGEAAFPPGYLFATWEVDRDFARWLPRLDDLAKTVLPDEDQARHRWLKLAPRYLGRLAQRQHSVALAENEFTKFQSMVREARDGAGEDAPHGTVEKRQF